MKDVIFIRHNMKGSTPRIIEQLWGRRLIALHYKDDRSIQPADYRGCGGEQPLQSLLDFCTKGALVGADYRIKGGVKSMLVGELEGGTQVIAMEFFDENQNFIYKTAQLQNVKEISYQDYPLLSAVQPPNVAISKWNSVRDYLDAIVTGKNLPWSVASLAPSQLEVLCYEYLRASNRIVSLLLPIGRNMKDIDIVGMNSQKQQIHAQITASHDKKVIQRKVKILEGYENVMIFAPDEMREFITAVEYISIQEVFQHMSTNPVYNFVLRQMLHYDAG